MTQAFEEDEKGNSDEAIELYSQAVELCIQAVSHNVWGKVLDWRHLCKRPQAQGPMQAMAEHLDFGPEMNKQQKHSLAYRNRMHKQHNEKNL